MSFHDVIDQQKDVSIYNRTFFLWKKQWDTYNSPHVPLNWQCVKFDRNNANLVPNEKGIYAFFIEPRIANFPSHGYLVYLGQTGHNSNRNLRNRFKDYLGYKKSPKRRRVHLMLNTWEDYLYFYYVKVDATVIDIKSLEQYLLDIFTPPFVERGYSAEVANIIKGLR